MSTKAWANEHGKDWEQYWKDPETALIHFIGKDNIVFHCLIFPVILKAYGGYNLPINVPANQFMNLEGDKVSTSRNWAVWIHEYLDEWHGKEDLMRYYLIKNMPEQRDSEFTWKGFQDACNNELVNNLANFFNRVMVLINKYYGGKIPSFDPDKGFVGTEDPDFDSFHEVELLNIFDRIQDLNQSIREFKFRDALKSLMDLSSTGNSILQANEPWKKEKTEPEIAKVVLNYCAQLCTALSVAIRPFRHRFEHGTIPCFILSTGDSPNFLTIADGEHGRDAKDAILLQDFACFISIDWHKFDPVAVFLCQFFEDWFGHHTRTAPWSPKINNDSFFCF